MFYSKMFELLYSHELESYQWFRNDQCSANALPGGVTDEVLQGDLWLWGAFMFFTSCLQDLSWSTLV